MNRLHWILMGCLMLLLLYKSFSNSKASSIQSKKIPSRVLMEEADGDALIVSGASVFQTKELSQIQSPRLNQLREERLRIKDPHHQDSMLLVGFAKELAILIERANKNESSALELMKYFEKCAESEVFEAAALCLENARRLNAHYQNKFEKNLNIALKKSKARSRVLAEAVDN